MNLWLAGTTTNGENKVAGVQAIREAGGRENWSLAAASDAWSKANRGWQTLILTTDDPDVMRAATSALDKGSLLYQITRDDESPSNVPDPQDPAADPAPMPEVKPPDEDWTPTVQATQGAAILLTATDDPGEALAVARSISRLTGDEFWEDVAEYIIRTFPGPPQVMAALLAQRQS